MREPRWRRYSRFWKRDVPGDVDDELQFHFEQRVEQYRESGLSESQANAAAHAQFGDVNTVRDQLIGIDSNTARAAAARARSYDIIEAVSQAARHALRSLRRSPAYS